MAMGRLAVIAIVAGLVASSGRTHAQPKLDPPDRWAEFGVSVAAAPGLIFVVASPKQSGRRGPGTVHVFERRGPDWVAAATLSVPHATMEDVREVSRIAHCHEFIEGFEKGYDTIVGERGVKLSGGQRQRIAIARALLADPKILILDEATSSLDSESEAMIQEGLRTLRRGRTTFVIAHRLSTIRSADQILVLEGGEIIERGAHEELLAAGGRYKQLYDKQYKFERDQFINPGEDFTPELPKLEIERRASTSRLPSL